MTQNLSETTAFETLRRALLQKSASAGVIGLGYVGLPLAAAIARSGMLTVGFDTDPDKITALNEGRSYIGAVGQDELRQHMGEERFRAAADFAGLAYCDVIVICVPTPLTKEHKPDLSYIEATAQTIAHHLRKGQLVVLESTSYPGTTREIVKPILESSGLASGKDFFLGFSPEREDPGNPSFATVDIPKIVSGDGAEAAELTRLFYAAVVKLVVPVSSMDSAEAVKITENVFRAVNIALVNEMKLIYGAMGIDVWEVIEAAKTKPFGYMPFYPGPGLGGHCIPIDPFYLSFKARQFGTATRFIELAGEINHAMPSHVIEVLDCALKARGRANLSGARILILGLAYKKNVSDVRESPTFKLIEILEHKAAIVSFHDPLVDHIPSTREHPDYAGRQSEALDARSLSSHDAVLIATDHDAFDYALIHAHAKLIVDTRNVMARHGFSGSTIVKA